MGKSISRCLRIAALSGALACAGLAVGTAPAGATSAPSPLGSSSIHVGDDCTFYSTGHLVGQVMMLRLGSHMLVLVTFSHAIPNSTYTVQLFGGPSFYNSCNDLAHLGVLHTNSRGTASGFFVAAFSPIDTYFFLGASNPTTFLQYETEWNESSLFFLPTSSNRVV